MIFVILPVFNEEKNIESVLKEIREVFTQERRDFRVIVVNDGSSDGTLAVIERCSKELPLELISFEENKGIGCVFREGFKKVRTCGKDNDILISLDCDRTHPPKTFILLIKALEDGADIAIASRYHPQSKTNGLPVIRVVLSDTINFILRLFYPVGGAKDYTTFFRAYRVGLLKKAIEKYGDDFIQQQGFPAMAEILIKLRVFVNYAAEVPLTLRFDLRTGKSKMKVFKTISGYLSLIFRS